MTAFCVNAITVKFVSSKIACLKLKFKFFLIVILNRRVDNFNKEFIIFKFTSFYFRLIHVDFYQCFDFMLYYHFPFLNQTYSVLYKNTYNVLSIFSTGIAERVQIEHYQSYTLSKFRIEQVSK